MIVEGLTVEGLTARMQAAEIDRRIDVPAMAQAVTRAEAVAEAGDTALQLIR